MLRVRFPVSVTALAANAEKVLGADRVAASSGSAAAPAFTFNDELSAGTFRSSAGVVGTALAEEEVSTLSGTTRSYFKHSGDTVSFEVVFKKSRGTEAIPDAVGINDVIGKWSVQGYDGSAYLSGGYLKFEVGLALGGHYMPCRFVAGVTSSGSASPTEAMRINNYGTFGFATADVELTWGTVSAVQLGAQCGFYWYAPYNLLGIFDNEYSQGTGKWYYKTTGYCGDLNWDTGTMYYGNVPYGTIDVEYDGWTIRFVVDNAGRASFGPAAGVNSAYSLTAKGGSSYGAGIVLSGASGYDLLVVEDSHASFASDLSRLQASRTSNAAWTFGQWYSNDGSDLEFQFSSDGNGTCDGAWTGGGADYAEMLPWSDGNPGKENRVGRTVVLSGKFVRPAKRDDDPDLVIGAISARPSFIGNAPIDKERANRSEWGVVGCKGQIRIRKGEPTNPEWVLLESGKSADLYWVR